MQGSSKMNKLCYIRWENGAKKDKKQSDAKQSAKKGL